MSLRIVVEPRGRPSLIVRLIFPLCSVAGASVIGAVLLLAAGQDPIEAYAAVLRSGFGSSVAWVGTLITATPLILTAVAVAVAFRMKIWNIGAEGQLLVGAIAASGVALALGDGMRGPVAVTATLFAGAVGGALWAMLAAVPRAFLRTDEVISTLMLNFVALSVVNYLIFDSQSFWRAHEMAGFPTGRDIPIVAHLPQIWMRLSLGFPLAVGVALLVGWFLRSSRWGFDIRVIGDSPLTGRYAGMDVRRRVISVFMVSGGIAGLAGAVLVGGSTYGLQPGSLAVGLGYTGIVVAAVSRLNPIAIIPVGIFIAGLSKSATSLQVLGIPSEIAMLLEGLALLLVVAAEFFMNNRVKLVARRGAAEGETA